MSASRPNEFEHFVDVIAQTADDRLESPQIILVAADLLDRFTALDIKRLERLLDVQLIAFRPPRMRRRKFKLDMLDYFVFGATFFVIITLLVRWI